jgi:hypothetical protein
MPNPTVAISVDCVCANSGKCYVPEIVEVAEQLNIPLTWLLGVAEHDPMSNLKLYHNEYFHRIPAWHELGMHLSFDTGTSNTMERGDLIRVGRDLLKQFSIKPTAFRAANGDLQAGDLRTLEDYGFIVDSTPGSSAGRPMSAPKAPYHPSHNNIHESGSSKLWVVPVANINGARGYLDDGFDRIKPIIEGALNQSPDKPVLSLALCDCVDNADNLRHVVSYLKNMNARFVTLTQLATEL